MVVKDIKIIYLKSNVEQGEESSMKEIDEKVKNNSEATWDLPKTLLVLLLERIDII